MGTKVAVFLQKIIVYIKVLSTFVALFVLIHNNNFILCI